jgi:hypothetical protein
MTLFYLLTGSSASLQSIRRFPVWKLRQSPQAQGEAVEVKSCGVCSHMEAGIINRFLRLPEGTQGKRGPRSLSKPFGLDRKAIQRHEKVCLGTLGKAKPGIADRGGGGCA